MLLSAYRAQAQDVLAFFAQHDVVDRISDVSKVALSTHSESLVRRCRFCKGPMVDHQATELFSFRLIYII